MEEKKKWPLWLRVLLWIGAILTFPLWITAAGVGVGTVALVICLIVLFLLIFAALVGALLLLGGNIAWFGVITFFSGLTWIGLFTLGIGFLMLAAGALGLLGAVWLFGVFFPWLFRTLAALFGKIFSKKEAVL